MATMGRHEMSREIAARERKVTAIVKVLRMTGATVNQVAKLDANGRKVAAILAGVTEPSDRTWDQVVQRYREVKSARILKVVK